MLISYGSEITITLIYINVGLLYEFLRTRNWVDPCQHIENMHLSWESKRG